METGIIHRERMKGFSSYVNNYLTIYFHLYVRGDDLVLSLIIIHTLTINDVTSAMHLLVTS